MKPFVQILAEGTDKLKYAVVWITAIITVTIVIAGICQAVELAHIKYPPPPDLLLLRGGAAAPAEKVKEEAIEKYIANYNTLVTSIQARHKAPYTALITDTLRPLFSDLIKSVLLFIFAAAGTQLVNGIAEYRKQNTASCTRSPQE